MPLAEAAYNRADELGMTMSDYIATLLAEDLDMLEYAPAQPDLTTRQELRIPAA